MVELKTVSWLDDYIGEPKLLQMRQSQIDYAKSLFVICELLKDMTVLESYLGTMPVIDIVNICTDTYDNSQAFK